MKPHVLPRLLLLVTGLYDGFFGMVFLLTAPAAFSICRIPAPSHWGYVHFAAALLLIFALMFFAASAHPAANRNLIAYGMLLKIAFVGVVAYHWTRGGVPFVFQILAVVDTACFCTLGWIFFAVAPRAIRPAKA
jgi:hypothetical protein